jgi:hypothetical protein
MEVPLRAARGKKIKSGSPIFMTLVSPTSKYNPNGMYYVQQIERAYLDRGRFWRRGFLSVVFLGPFLREKGPLISVSCFKTNITHGYY